MRHAATAPRVAKLALFPGDCIGPLRQGGYKPRAPGLEAEAVLTAEQVAPLAAYLNTLKYE